MNTTKEGIIPVRWRGWKKSGEVWALIGVLGYATANLFEAGAVKHADPMIGPLVRGIPTLIWFAILLRTRKTYRQLQPKSPEYVGGMVILLFVIPGVVSTLGLFTYFWALQLGGVAVTIPVQKSYIIWGALAGWIYLGERLRARSFLGVGLVVIGLVALGLGQMHGKPVTAQWALAIPLALFTAISFGISGVFWRAGQLRGADQSTGIFINIVASEIVAIVGLIGTGHMDSLFKTPAANLGALLVGGVLSGIVGLYGMVTSLRLMSVARAYAFSSLNPLLAAMLASIFLKEHINPEMIAGIALVTIGVALVQMFKPVEKDRQSGGQG